jgi:LmbE family N-acetylglucosaminyl deacetylase
MRRVLLPLARRIGDANLFARAVARRDQDLIPPPTVGRPPDPVVVLAPHPDDEAIGCGGVLALSDSPSVVYLTGSDERRGEAESACGELGVGEVVFLGLEEGRFEGNEAVLAEALARLRPATLLLPWPLERQADHAAAARLAVRALPEPAPLLWCYEVWSPLDPNRLVDITPVVERKLAAIELHVSQTRDLDYADAALGLNRYRALLAPGSTYAEAYYECSPEALRLLARV